MRLGIDAWGLAGPTIHTGIGQYTRTLIVGMAESKIGVVAFGGPDEQAPSWLPSNVEWVPLGSDYGRLAGFHSRFRQLPDAVQRHGVDVMHTPGVHVRPSLPPVPSPGRPHVVTLHDVIPLTHYGPTLPMRNQIFYRWNLRRAAKADRLVTVSKAARADIAATIGMPEDMITVVTSAVDFAPNPDVTVLARYEIANPYVLFAGSFEPRKNLAHAMRGFDRYVRDGGQLDLVAVTDPGSGHEPKAVEVRDSLSCAARIRFVGRVPDADLRALYTHTRGVLMPSAAEGFGLPVIQALGCGVPVVVSPLPVYDDTVGDLAKRVDPADQVAMATAINELDSDHEWQSIVKRDGPARAKRYAPRHCIQDHLALYQELKERPYAMA